MEGPGGTSAEQGAAVGPVVSGVVGSRREDADSRSGGATLIRTVLADDHPLVLGALEALFDREPDIEVVATCTAGVAAVAAVAALEPDVLILDLKMPDLDGLGVLRALSGMQSPTRSVLLTAAASDRELIESIRLNVRGVLLKETDPSLIVQCVRKVHAGQIWVETESIVRLAQSVSTTAPGFAVLTPREHEVARLAAEELSNREIAGLLALTEGTVKVHLHHVYAKLGLSGRRALRRHVREHHLL